MKPPPQDDSRQRSLPFDDATAGRPPAEPPSTEDLRGQADGQLPGRRSGALLLAVAAALLLFAGIGSVPLLDPDEARYAAASRSMLDRGDLIVPYFNGAERLNKPALFYWLQAGAFRVLGGTEAAARLPSVAAALLVLLSVYLFAKRELGRETALRAGLILLTTPLFAIVGKTAITDMTLCLFIVLALIFWYRLLEGRGQRRVQWLAASLSLGLAFFVKGPVGILLPCSIMAGYVALARGRASFRLRGVVLGAAVAGAVFLPWAVLLVYRLGAARVQDSGAGTAAATLPAILSRGAGRVADLLQRETIERTMEGLDHPEPFYYLLVAAMVVFFPWSAYAPFAIGRAYGAMRRREPATLFLVLWMAIVLVFFSFVKGKLVTYILPAAPPLAILLGREWARLAEATAAARAAQREGSPSASAISAAWVPQGAALVVALTLLLAGYVIAAPADWLSDHRPAALSLASLIAIAALVPPLIRWPERSDLVLACAVSLPMLALPFVAGQELGERRSLRDLSRDAGVAERPWSHVIAYKMFRPSLVWYGHRTVTIADDPEALREALDPEGLVILEERRFIDFDRSWRDSFRIIASQRSFLAVAPISPLPPHGPRGPRHDGTPEDRARIAGTSNGAATISVKALSGAREARAPSALAEAGG